MIQKPIKKKAIEEAYQKIRSGGLAIIPSRVGYTLLGNTDQSIQKMFDLKGRPLSKPCVVLTARSILEEIAKVPKKYLPLIDALESQKLLCGLVLKRRKHSFFDSLPPFANDCSKRENNTSCFVINAGEYIQHLVDQSMKDKTFIVGSSANKSGTGNEGIFLNIPKNIRVGVDVAIEDDRFVMYEYNPQTREQGVMVDLTGDKPIIIRKGLMLAKIQQLLETSY